MSADVSPELVQPILARVNTLTERLWEVRAKAVQWRDHELLELTGDLEEALDHIFDEIAKLQKTEKAEPGAVG